MNFQHLFIILIICGFIYYLYKMNNNVQSQTQTHSTTQLQTIEQKSQEKEQALEEIILPTPFINPYINPYYEPYYYPYWDPYDLYPYGIIGVDAGADWNSTYNVVSRYYHRRGKDRYNRNSRGERRRSDRRRK